MGGRAAEAEVEVDATILAIGRCPCDGMNVRRRAGPPGQASRILCQVSLNALGQCLGVPRKGGTPCG